LDDEDSNLLAFASEVGEIVFFLRNSKDAGTTVPDIVTAASITLDQDNASSGLVGSYLYLSATTPDQEIKTLLTLTDAVVNEELRSGIYRKSVPIGQLTASAKEFDGPGVGAVLPIPQVNDNTENNTGGASTVSENAAVEGNTE